MALILLLQQKGCVDTKAAGYCTSLAAKGKGTEWAIAAEVDVIELSLDSATRTV